jgi:hypothetical protein
MAITFPFIPPQTLWLGTSRLPLQFSRSRSTGKTTNLKPAQRYLRREFKLNQGISRFIKKIKDLRALSFHIKKHPENYHHPSAFGASCASLGISRRLPLEPMVGIEPTTYGLRNRCSTTELHWPQIENARAQRPGNGMVYNPLLRPGQATALGIGSETGNLYLLPDSQATFSNLLQFFSDKSPELPHKNQAMWSTSVLQMKFISFGFPVGNSGVSLDIHGPKYGRKRKG